MVAAMAFTGWTHFSGKLQNKTVEAELCLVLRVKGHLGLENLEPLRAGIVGEEAEARNSLASIENKELFKE